MVRLSSLTSAATLLIQLAARIVALFLSAFPRFLMRALLHSRSHNLIRSCPKSANDMLVMDRLQNTLITGEVYRIESRSQVSLKRTLIFFGGLGSTGNGSHIGCHQETCVSSK